MQRRYWTKQEDDALSTIINGTHDINWNFISEKMTFLFNHSRNAKQCRERWINKINRNSSDQSLWSSDEDQIILKQFLAKGRNNKKKWIHIAQKIKTFHQNDGKDDQKAPNEIKNRFYSIFRKGIRRINNEFGRPVIPEQIRLLKPNGISKMFESLQNEQCHKYLQIIYAKTCNISEKANKQQLKRQELRKILTNVMQFNKKETEQQKEPKVGKKKEKEKKETSKKRKSSLSTNQENKVQEWNQSQVFLQNEQRYKEREQNDYVGMFIKKYVEQSASLQFQSFDL